MPQVFVALLAKVGITGMVATVLGYVAYTIVTVALLRALAPKPSFGQMRGLLTNTRGATDPQNYVYGTVRKGGTITYLEATGTTNQYLHMIIVLAGHEVNAIGDIYINDEVATLDGSGFVTSGGWNSKIRVKKHLGTAAQTTDASLLAESAQINSNFRGRGIAYLYIRLEYDQDVFTNGIPLFSAVVQGKKVFDPRTSTTAFSANAALCIRDYLVDARGLGDSAIDNTSFSAAANVCDENVSLSGGGTEKRYTINGVISADQSIQDALQQMVTACGGSLWWGGGSWKLKPGYYTAPVKTLTLDDIVSEISTQTRVPMRDNFNIVRGTFNDSAQRWIAAEYPQLRSAAFIAEDDGVESPVDIEFPLTTSSATVQRLAKQMLFRNREQLTFTADFGMAALQLQVGDIVALTIDRYGWSAKEFEVVSWTFGANGEAGDLRVTMTLRETSSAAFSWTAEESAITGNNSNLPDPSSGLTITNLTASAGGRTQTDGTRINSAILNWDDASNKFVDYYEVEWRPVADSNYASTTTDESDIELSPIIDSIQYIFRVRAVTIAGVRGGWTSVTLTGGGDTTAPGLPTAISANGQFGYIEIKWTNPTDSDFSHVEVYENTVDNSATSTLAGISAGSNFIRNNLALSVTRYYWLKSVDFSNNKSAFTAGVSATTSYLDNADFSGGIYSLFTAQGLYAIRDVTSLPGSGAFVGEKIYNRTDGKLYQWTGAAWTLVIADVAAGSITETKIATDAITTPKIAANAVTAAEIAAATITGDRIVANTITGGLLATSGIITNSAQINNAVITNAKINDLSAEKINAGVLSASRLIGSGAVRISRGSYNATITLSDTIDSGDFSVTLTGVTVGNIIEILAWGRMEYGITTYMSLSRSGISGTAGFSTQLQAPAGTSDSDAWVLGGTATSTSVSASFLVIPAGSGTTTVTYDLEIIILEFYK